MTHTSPVPSFTPARLYVATVGAIGVTIIGSALVAVWQSGGRSDWWSLAALTLLTGSFSIKVPTVNARVSVSEAFVFVAVLLFGDDVGTLIVALDALVLSSWLRGKSRSPLRVLFNMSAGAIAISFATSLFHLTLKEPVTTTMELERLVIPMVVLASAYFLINSSLIAFALAFEQRKSALEIWRANFVWLSLNYLGGSSVALLLFTYTRYVNFTALSVIVPLLVIIYLTLRTSLGRLDEANKHLSQVSDLYLSTVEALAMAVDAKDQITHGHIRRVQVYAVELAKRLGVTDSQQLKAIEVAALLHDMGKLAIPEHILNKPGRLTPAEFQRMKQHAGLGADLLSSIRFPYPVVPIVRYHHENWNGSGYPAGIAGTDIPLGARILSVVDCFDALTSDRPYRPRLSTEDAFGILRERSGTMYDPLVVDTFASAYSAIAPAAIRAGEEARSLSSLGDSSHSSPIAGPLTQIRETASETAALSAYQLAISQTSSLAEAMEIAAQCLRQLTPGTTYALYRYDSHSDDLVCDATFGDPGGLLRGLRIRVGERVTGWSAANQTISINSEASLDLGQIAQMFDPPLRSTITTPIVADDRLVAVLTAYSIRPNAFSERNRYTFEQVVPVLAQKSLGVIGDTQSNVVSFPRQRGSQPPNS